MNVPVERIDEKRRKDHSMSVIRNAISEALCVDDNYKLADFGSSCYKNLFRRPPANIKEFCNSLLEKLKNPTLAQRDLHLIMLFMDFQESGYRTSDFFLSRSQEEDYARKKVLECAMRDFAFSTSKRDSKVDSEIEEWF